MSKRNYHQVNPIFLINLNHSLSEWLTNRVNRATFAATAYVSILITASQNDAISSEEITNIVGGAIRTDTIYVLQIGKSVAVLFLCEEKSLLLRFTPNESIAAFEILRLDYHEEQLANGIFESMIMKRTINSFFHIEAEEFIVMNEMISNSIHEDESKTEDSNNDEDKTDDDNDSEEEYASEDDYEDDAEYESHYIMDDNGRYYDAESWYEDHMNPPGTTDCGDGYLDADGVFTEY